MIPPINSILLGTLLLSSTRGGVGVDAFIPRAPAVLVSRSAGATLSEPFSLDWHVLNFKERSDVSVSNLTDIQQQQKLAPQSASPPKVCPFIPWDVPMIESSGNYCEESYLERHIGGQLYENNEQLPRLPIPSLKETIERFIPTALPLCESDEERQTLLEACESFEDDAQHLQQRLEERREQWSDSSWLMLWWNQMGYLQVRDPVAVHVSYFLNINDDPTLPTEEELDGDGTASNGDDYGGASNPGVLRGAAAITAAAEVRRRICSGLAPCDKVGNDPLCSAGYKYMFHSCRIPRPKADTFRIYDPSLHRHCIVACRGYFFAVDFVDDESNPLPFRIMVERLEQCEKEARLLEEEGLPKLGWLTGCDRDFWAESRMLLLNKGGSRMRDAMNLLESGAFVLCIDQERPETTSEAGRVFWHGNGSSGCNRWFDKSIQLVCTKDGRIALVGEHSLFDGSTPMLLCKQIQKNKYKRLGGIARTSKLAIGSDVYQEDDGVRDVFGKCWSEDEFVDMSLHLAAEGREQYQELTDSVEFKTLIYNGYGKPFIKKGKVSPDAYLQLAMQLATYRLFGKQLATYEATQTRRFVHGRTETTRTVSFDSQHFVEAMGPTSKESIDDVEAKYEKLLKLRKAAKTHQEYTKSASSGRGVDRHFLGLSLVQEDGEITPDLFSHPAFIRSKSWRLSTSSLPYVPGFGPVVADGLGVGYGLTNDSLIFNISSQRENKYVSKFGALLEDALTEMKGLLEAEDMCDWVVPCEE